MFGLKERTLPFWRKVLLSYTKHRNKNIHCNPKFFVNGRGKHGEERERMRVGDSQRERPRCAIGNIERYIVLPNKKYIKI